jgi:phosphatidylinositol-3-phosphatase
MNKIASLLTVALAFAGCSPSKRAGSEITSPPPKPAATAEIIPWPEGLPNYDHIVIVVEENKDWADIINNSDAPYINQLAREGALFTKSFGLEHHSQGNYFWLFSGSNQGVGFMDEVPGPCPDNYVPSLKSEDPTYCNPGGAGYPFTASNLAQQLIDKKYTFKGYSESLPEIGSTVDKTHYGGAEEGRIAYARKHVPWVSFSNVPNGDTVETSSNLRFEDFPSAFSQLPTVSFVIPDLQNDMHNLHELTGDHCKNKGSVCVGDAWLKTNLDAYYQWAKTNNSLLIFTFDEDNGMGYAGLTDPGFDTGGDDCKTEIREDPESGDRDALEITPCGMRNGIVTIFAGAHIKPGQYEEGVGITHVNILRTIEAMYGLPKSGAQQAHALAAGISDDYIITDVFTTSK